MSNLFNDLWLPPSGTVVCPANAVEPEQTRGFIISDPHSTKYLDLIIWHRPDGIRGFVNRCPHLGLPLETFPNRFLNALGDALVCSAHGARFDATGHCLAGPCAGEALVPLELDVRPRSHAEPTASERPANGGTMANAGADKNIVLIGRLTHS